MIALPLHPAVVHFPIAFVALLPVVAIGALWAIRRGRAPRVAWAAPAVLSLLLAASVFVAMRTGESEEDVAGPVVSEARIEHHEESAERFAALVYGTAVLAVLGLLHAPVGGVARAVATIAAVGLLGGGIIVGHSGGELVYRFGAARAYETSPTPAAPGQPAHRDETHE